MAARGVVAFRYVDRETAVAVAEDLAKRFVALGAVKPGYAGLSAGLLVWWLFGRFI